jgi:hypothetical protein
LPMAPTQTSPVLMPIRTVKGSPKRARTESA